MRLLNIPTYRNVNQVLVVEGSFVCDLLNPYSETGFMHLLFLYNNVEELKL